MNSSHCLEGDTHSLGCPERFRGLLFPYHLLTSSFNFDEVQITIFFLLWLMVFCVLSKKYLLTFRSKRHSFLFSSRSVRVLIFYV